MKIVIGADHRGREALRFIRNFLAQTDHEVIELETDGRETVDYPDLAYLVASAVSTSKADSGILTCGTGIGMSIAANKVKDVRAAVVHDEIGADMSRRHNDANVLCVPADMLGNRIIGRIVTTWLETPFEGGRHARRVEKINAIEAGGDPRHVEKEKGAEQFDETMDETVVLD